MCNKCLFHKFQIIRGYKLEKILQKEKFIRNKINTQQNPKYLALKKNEKVFECFERIAKSISNGTGLLENIPKDIIEYYLVNSMIFISFTIGDTRYYEFTGKRRDVYRKFFR